MVGSAEAPRAEQFAKIISLLRFFAETGRFNVLDRIGMAQSPTAVREAIYEALRTVRALERRPARLKLGVEVEVKKDGEKRRETREVEVECLDYETVEEKAECRGIYGVVKDVLSGAPRDIIGRRVCCYLKPWIPDEVELGRFFEALEGEGGLELAKELAALAFAYRPASGGAEGG